MAFISSSKAIIATFGTYWLLVLLTVSIVSAYDSTSIASGSPVGVEPSYYYGYYSGVKS